MPGGAPGSLSAKVFGLSGGAPDGTPGGLHGTSLDTFAVAPGSMPCLGPAAFCGIDAFWSIVSAAFGGEAVSGGAGGAGAAPCGAAGIPGLDAGDPALWPRPAGGNTGLATLGLVCAIRARSAQLN